MCKVRYKIKGTSLELTSSSGKSTTVGLQWPVKEVLVFGTVFVVRTEPQPGAHDNENVHGVSEDGGIVWTVPKRKYIYADSPFTGIVEEKGTVKLLNWDGTEISVDPQTGTIIQESYGK